MAVKRQIVAGVASLAALYVGVSNAIGLGEMQLQSALNQPFNAVIEVQGSQGIHADDIRVSLASNEAFLQAGVERSHFLTGLRFVPVTEGGRLQIRVQSERPVREPYLNFLVELRQPSGRILREYVVLLDPPMYNPATGRTAAPATSTSQRTAAAAPVPRTRTPAPAQTQALPDLTPASDAARYTTVAGDTLWGIASARRPGADAGIRDTMLAIRALNPQAFIDGDINRLRQNQELILPTAAQLGVAATVPSSDPDSAEVADSAVPSASPSPREQQPEVSDSAAPETDGDPATAVAAAGTEDRLRIEALPEAVSGDAQAMQQRLTALESRFNILLSELEDRDNQIAMLQAELEIMRTAREAEEDAAASGVIAGGQLGGPEQGGPSSPGGTDSPAAGSLSADPLPASDTAAAPPPAAAEQRSWVAWLWMPLAALLAFLVGLLVMRRRERDPAEEAIEPVPPMQEEPRVLVPRPVIKPQEAPKAAVDPLDGVELYLTYGRFAEARGMLDKAISEDPQRLELRYKQLRVLGELEDRAAFDQLAEETLALGGEAASIEQVRMRFPAMRQSAADKADQVEQVDSLEPLLDDDDLDFDTRMQDESADEEAVDEGQMNLNDFSLDPDWDLIDALGPETKARKDTDQAAKPEAEPDDDFESSLDRLPEVEELDDHDHSDQQKDGTRR